MVVLGIKQACLAWDACTTRLHQSDTFNGGIHMPSQNLGSRPRFSACKNISRKMLLHGARKSCLGLVALVAPPLLLLQLKRGHAWEEQIWPLALAGTSHVGSVRKVISPIWKDFHHVV
jgi:hypothetical protein